MELNFARPLAEVAIALLTAYAVYAIIVGGFGSALKLRTTWMEKLEAVGGVLVLVGAALLSRGDLDTATALCFFGTSTFVVPRLILIARRAFDG